MFVNELDQKFPHICSIVFVVCYFSFVIYCSGFRVGIFVVLFGIFLY